MYTLHSYIYIYYLGLSKSHLLIPQWSVLDLPNLLTYNLPIEFRNLTTFKILRDPWILIWVSLDVMYMIYIYSKAFSFLSPFHRFITRENAIFNMCNIFAPLFFLIKIYERWTVPASWFWKSIICCTSASLWAIQVQLHFKINEPRKWALVSFPVFDF